MPKLTPRLAGTMLVLAGVLGLVAFGVGILGVIGGLRTGRGVTPEAVSVGGWLATAVALIRIGPRLYLANVLARPERRALAVLTPIVVLLSLGGIGVAIDAFGSWLPGGFWADYSIFGYSPAAALWWLVVAHDRPRDGSLPRIRFWASAIAVSTAALAMGRIVSKSTPEVVILVGAYAELVAYVGFPFWEIVVGRRWRRLSDEPSAAASG